MIIDVKRLSKIPIIFIVYDVNFVSSAINRGPNSSVVDQVKYTSFKISTIGPPAKSKTTGYKLCIKFQEHIKSKN